MKSLFEKMCYAVTYALALIIYCVVLVMFVLVGAAMYAIWWVYEPLVKMLKGGQDAQETKDK
jgi:hypothetical protein